MLSFSLSIIATAALLQSATASPTPQLNLPNVSNVLNAVNPIGFDPSLIHPLALGEIVPVHTVLTAADLANNTITSIPPYVSPTAQKGKRFIVGTDDRTYNADTSYPYAAVGKLTWSNGVFCSGAVVGPRHVLTARHCLPTQSGISGVFTPGYNNGAPFGSGQVTQSVSVSGGDGACGTKADWAVLLVSTRIGDTVGSFGLAYPSTSFFDQPRFIHQGYPGDRDNGNRPQRQVNNTIASRNSLDCDSTGPIYSDTDTAGGQSGGPIWFPGSDGPYIWGALSISVSSPNYVYAGWASGNQMINAIISLRNQYP